MRLLLRKEVGGGREEKWRGLEGHVKELERAGGGARWEDIALQANAAVRFTKSPLSCIMPAVDVLCRVRPLPFPQVSPYHLMNRILISLKDGN